jgi:hypothetical protein
MVQLEDKKQMNELDISYSQDYYMSSMEVLTVPLNPNLLCI